MAQPGYTPIITYNSSTTGHVPTTGSGTITTGELAVNITDGILFIGTGTNTYNTLVASKGTTAITTLGTVTTGTWNATTIAVGYGGTGGTATPTAGAVAYGTGSAYAFTAAGTAGYYLQSNGSSPPTWTAVSGGISTGKSIAMAMVFGF